MAFNRALVIPFSLSSVFMLVLKKLGCEPVRNVFAIFFSFCVSSLCIPIRGM